MVAEELLAAGAPVAAHWIADRQSGPQIYRHGSEPLRERFLPAIARGECYFSLGMSEPESGSDLASVRARARAVDGGWVLNGTKVWTSHAHHSHFITVLCRTEDAGDDPHEGLSILVVDLAAPGVTVRPIRLITGEHHFNEVIFEDVRVAARDGARRSRGGMEAGHGRAVARAKRARALPQHVSAVRRAD